MKTELDLCLASVRDWGTFEVWVGWHHLCEQLCLLGVTPVGVYWSESVPGRLTFRSKGLAQLARPSPLRGTALDRQSMFKTGSRLQNTQTRPTFSSHPPDLGLHSAKASRETIKDCPNLHHCCWFSLKMKFHLWRSDVQTAHQSTYPSLRTALCRSI